MALEVAVTTDWALALALVAMGMALALAVMVMATAAHFTMEDMGYLPSSERLTWKTNR